MYREIDVRSPFEWKGYLCWLHQRDTYPATPVAPLSKGDAAAVTLVNAIDAAIVKNNCSTVASLLSSPKNSYHRQMHRHRESPLSKGNGTEFGREWKGLRNGVEAAVVAVGLVEIPA